MTANYVKEIGAMTWNNYFVTQTNTIIYGETIIYDIYELQKNINDKYIHDAMSNDFNIFFTSFISDFEMIDDDGKHNVFCKYCTSYYDSNM